MVNSGLKKTCSSDGLPEVLASKAGLVSKFLFDPAQEKKKKNSTLHYR